MVGGLQRGAHDGNIGDGAGYAGNLHKLAQLKGLADQDGHTGKDVGQDVLYRQGQCQGDYGQQCDQRGHVEAHGAGDDENGHCPEDDVDGGLGKTFDAGIQLDFFKQALCGFHDQVHCNFADNEHQQTFTDDTGDGNNSDPESFKRHITGIPFLVCALYV